VQPYRTSAAPAARFSPWLEAMLRHLAPRHRLAREALGGHWERPWAWLFPLDVARTRRVPTGDWRQVPVCWDDDESLPGTAVKHVDCEDWGAARVSA